MRATVRRGDVVLDLGAGTGILGLLACESGARQVYSIDRGPIAELARELYAENGHADRAAVIKAESTQAVLPQRADVVVSDQIGAIGIDAGMLGYFADAARRLLKRGARAVPSRLDVWAAPVEQPGVAAGVGFWAGEVAGFSLRPVRSVARNSQYLAHLAARNLLSRAVKVASFDTLRHDGGKSEYRGTLKILRPGTLHGIGAWFSAQLSSRVRMTNSPLAAQRIDRSNAVYPLEPATKVRSGDELHLRCTILPDGPLLTWSAELLRAGRMRDRVRLTHSSALGLLISREDLAHTDPGRIPSLTPWGEARKTVLALCNGRRSLGAIEGEVARRHRGLFASRAEAARFVTEVMKQHAR